MILPVGVRVRTRTTSPFTDGREGVVIDRFVWKADEREDCSDGDEITYVVDDRGLRLHYKRHELIAMAP